MYALYSFHSSTFFVCSFKKQQTGHWNKSSALITTLMSNNGLVYYLIFNKSKKQSRMDISETLVTLDTQDTTQKTEKMSITGPSKNRGELMVLAKCKQFLLLIGTRHVIHKKIHCIDG
jgi:hypothetical protein